MSSGNLPTAETNNEQLLSDISNLQQIETELLNNLENNTSLTAEEEEKIITKVNNISKMRVNLYQSLDNMNSYYMTALDSSRDTLREQTAAVSIVEKELERSKEKLKSLEVEQNQKVRLAQINEYYSEKYTEHALLMKIIIAILVPILILAILNNKGILPDSAFNGLVVVIGIIGSFFFGKVMFSIFYRDNMNYQAYDWGFDASNAPTRSTSSDADASGNSDPWKSTTTIGLNCIGDACCGSGMTFDASSNLCVISSNNNSANNVDSFANLNSTFYANLKPSVYLGSENIEPMSFGSFIYGKS